MALFGLFGKKEEDGRPKPVPIRELGYFRQILTTMVVKGLTEKDGRIRAEDAVTLMATIAAERCIDAAGDIPLRDHELVPGSRVFSDKINTLLFGASGGGSWEELPPFSCFGCLRDQWLAQGFQKVDFPDLKQVLEHFAANTGKPEDGGSVPLTVPKENLPRLSPLKIGFESRANVDKVLRQLPDKFSRLTASLWALAEIVNQTRASLSPPVGIRLAVEILHGMAKTAPMTKRQLEKGN